ncbi:MAG: hypothetical protein K6F83_04300 [Clostridiales bacterium]|nr:hypothetical protein [Clostridiales bacterium]
MKKRIVASFLICSALIFSTALSSCSKTDGAETSATVTVIVDTTPSSDTPKETAVPYDVNNNTEFEEPILFEVTKEVIAYKDVSATEEAGLYTEGMCITGVSTDGFYIMQDDGCIIEKSCLKELD